jgi:hypothetical protein
LEAAKNPRQGQRKFHNFRPKNKIFRILVEVEVEPHGMSILLTQIEMACVRETVSRLAH